MSWLILFLHFIGKDLYERLLAIIISFCCICSSCPFPTMLLITLIPWLKTTVLKVSTIFHSQNVYSETTYLGSIKYLIGSIFASFINMNTFVASFVSSICSCAVISVPTLLFHTEVVHHLNNYYYCYYKQYRLRLSACWNG